MIFLNTLAMAVNGAFAGAAIAQHDTGGMLFSALGICAGLMAACCAELAKSA